MLTKCWDDENAPAAMMDEHLRGRVLFKFFHFSVIVYNRERSETARAKADIVASRERADETIRIQKETGSWRAVREQQQAETERAKIEAEREKVKEKTTVALPGEEDELQIWIDRYSRFWIFLAPFLCGVLGKFALAFAISLPGGAEFGRPTSRLPLPASGSAGPTPAPPGPSNPAPQGPTSFRPRTTIPAGRNAGGKSPNP